MNQAALFQRLRIILINGSARILSVLGTPIVSLIIVRTQSAEVWGSAVQTVLILDFAGRSSGKAVEAILDKCENVNKIEKTNFGAFRMRSLIEELVTSELFLAK